MLAILTSHPIQYQAPLWRALAADGRVPFEVWFLTPHGVQPTRDVEFGHTFAWDEDLLSGYRHHFVPVCEGWSLDRFRGVRPRRPWSKLLDERGVTTLWVEGWRFDTLWQAIGHAQDTGRRVWLRGESSDLIPEAWHARWWKRPLLRRLFAHIDAFLTIGSANRRFYHRYGVPESRLHPAPYSVDNDGWSAVVNARGSRRAELRARWGIAPEARCLLFAGKLTPRKRPLDLIAAATRLPRSLGPLHLLFAGEGELRDVLAEALKQPGAPPATLAGFLNLSQMPDAYAAADALVLPSDHETWGLAVNEALASGLPVVVSDRCGCAADLVAPVEPSLIFRSGDVEDLSRALRRLLEHAPAADAWAQVLRRHHVQTTVATVANLWMHARSPAHV